MMETDRVYENLLRRIISLELEPGSTVTQAYLSELLECGRTPLREATQRLMVEGLVVHTPNRGISIAPLDIRHYAQIDEAYRLMNNEAVRLAALRRTDAQVAEVQEILDTARSRLSAGQFSGLAPLDVDFHCRLSEASKNQFLADAAARMEKLVMRFASLSWVSEAASEVHWQLWNYHQKILDAVRNQDPDEAERAFDAHIDVARRQVLTVLGMPDLAQTGARG
jgi:GntR family transcriptional regulator, rspAB operon transcriptional repressor